MVLDASVALTFFLEHRATPATDRLLDRFWSLGATAPVFWPYEVANGLIKAGRRDGARREHVAEQLSLLAAMTTHVRFGRDGGDVRALTFRLAIEYQLSTYDAAYLALARASDLPLATLDRPLRQACGRLGVAVLPGLET